MKRFGNGYLLPALILMFILPFAAGCGDDDDDDDDDNDNGDPTEDDDDAVEDDDDSSDDDDDSAETTAQQFCQRVTDCEEAAEAYVVDGACEASAGQMDQESLDCAQEESCGDFVDCVESTEDGWLYDPITLKQAISVVSTEFGGYVSTLAFGNKITPFETLFIDYQYNDQEECDIKEGSVWGRIDDGEWESLKSFGANAACKQTGYDYTEVFEIDGASLSEGTHTAGVVFVDGGGQQGEVKTYTFQIEQYEGGLGSELSELEDAGFFLPGINPPDKGSSLVDIYFNQFAGKILLINASATWCGYCQDESDELMDLYNEYNGLKEVGVEVEFMTLLTDIDDMDEDEDIDENDILLGLQEWADRDDPHLDIAFPLMSDDNLGFASDYMLNVGVPFNMIVDAEGIVRYKIHGYASVIGDDFLDVIDALILEAEAK